MSNAFFIDTTLCTGCRGCQVACKQWHDLPAEVTTNRGSYQNPADLSFDTYKLVRMKEEIIDGQLRWLFFPDQCRHCVEAPCLDLAEDPSAIYRDQGTGAVLYTAQTRQLASDEIIESCPYNIPRVTKTGLMAKCDMCNDRVHNGLLPACVKTCPTGTMNFGSREAMLTLANQRYKAIKPRFPQAALLNPQEVRVIYLTAYDPGLYHDFALAAAGSNGITRKLAFRRMLRPFARAAKTLSA